MFLLGPLLVFVFTLSQSVRDVYFGSVFQRLDFLLVILLAFSWSTVIFAATTLIRAPSDFAKLRAQSGPMMELECCRIVRVPTGWRFVRPTQKARGAT